MLPLCHSDPACAFGILTRKYGALQSTEQQERCLVMCIITNCVVLDHLLRHRLGTGQFQVDHMGLNLDYVLHGNKPPYPGRNPNEASKAQQSDLGQYSRRVLDLARS